MTCYMINKKISREIVRFFPQTQRYIHTMSIKMIVEWADGYVAIQIENRMRDNLVIRPMSYV